MAAIANGDPSIVSLVIETLTGSCYWLRGTATRTLLRRWTARSDVRAVATTAGARGKGAMVNGS